VEWSVLIGNWNRDKHLGRFSNFHILPLQGSGTEKRTETSCRKEMRIGKHPGRTLVEKNIKL
jgi:hypothetical protein